MTCCVNYGGEGIRVLLLWGNNTIEVDTALDWRVLKASMKSEEPVHVQAVNYGKLMKGRQAKLANPDLMMKSRENISSDLKSIFKKYSSNWVLMLTFL